jgi:serine/threonine protein phosphatase PrpC
MGNLLGAPVIEKETHVGSTSEGLAYGVSSMQGWRVHMEDAHITEPKMYAFDTATKKKIDLPGHGLFAIFDGHGGTFAAAYAGRNLCRVLSTQPKFLEYAAFEKERPAKEKTFTKSSEFAHNIQAGLSLLEQALCDAFVEIDKEIASALKGQKAPDADTPYHPEAANPSAPSHLSSGEDNTSNGDESPADAALRLLQEEGDSGTTACVVVMTPEWIVCANAGDSRAVMSKLGNRVVPLSYDHKPDDDAEEKRIRAAGGYVAGGRVEGDLAVSRGLGDFRFKNMDVVMKAVKWEGATPSSADTSTTPQQQPVSRPEDQKVSPIPDIILQHRNRSQDEFVVIACDGIWDVQTNYEGVKTIAELFQEGESNLGLVCEEVSSLSVVFFFCNVVAGRTKSNRARGNSFSAWPTVSVSFLTYLSFACLRFSYQTCDVCLQMGSKDNMTTLVIKMEAQKIGDGGGVMARRQQRDSEANDDNGQGSPNTNFA